MTENKHLRHLDLEISAKCQAQMAALAKAFWVHYSIDPNAINFSKINPKDLDPRVFDASVIAAATELYNEFHSIEHLDGGTREAKSTSAPDTKEANLFMPAEPPGFAEALIPLLMPRKRADALLGDLQEQFETDVAAVGEQRARRLYVSRVLRSIWPLAKRWVKAGGIFAFVAGLWGLARRYLGG